MKSLVKRTLYAGLGLVGTGTQAIEHLGRELAHQADLSEKEGVQVARRLRQRSQKAIDAIHKTLYDEVNSVIDALHVEAKKDVASMTGKRQSTHKHNGRAKQSTHTSAAKTHHRGAASHRRATHSTTP